MSDLKTRVNEILTTNGLDFTVEKLPLVAPRNRSVITDGGEIVDEVQLVDSPYFGLYNSKSGEIINTVKKGYTVSQNDEVVELVLRGMDGFGELSVQKAGSLNGGRRVFIQLAIDGLSVVGDDRVKRYVTIIDSNDGTTGLSVGIGDLTRKANELVTTTYRPLEIYTFLILEYLVLILVVSYFVRKLENKLEYK